MYPTFPTFEAKFFLYVFSVSLYYPPFLSLSSYKLRKR
jgi:hypothetical protein